MKKYMLVPALLLLTAFGTDADQQYWPQWRGPAGISMASARP